MERVQKIMAHANIGSRRECEKLIKEGRVKVNGRLAKLGDKADAAKDKIEVNGRLLSKRVAAKLYIALNKPKGVISSLEDELGAGRTTVRDLIELPGHLYPVGRLDRQSEGLMLMTNDGDMAHKLTHPRFGHQKLYHVVIDGQMTDETIRKWEKGVWLDGSYTAPAIVECIHRHQKSTQLRVLLREGRKRQIRRIASMFGHDVKELTRIQIGSLRLGSLKSGQWRHLTVEEVSTLKQSIQTKPAPRQNRQRGKSNK